MSQNARVCGQKLKYFDRKAARKGRRNTPTSTHLTVYACPYCGWYHLGHQPQDVRNGKSDKNDWLRRTNAR